MQERGVVTAAEGSFADVEIVRHAACKGCQGCTMTGEGKMLARVHNSRGARPGDRVVLTLDDGQVLKAAAAVYIVPLIALIAGYALAAALATMLSLPETLVGVAGAIAGLLASLVWVARYDRSSARKETFHFKMEIENRKESLSAP